MMMAATLPATLNVEPLEKQFDTQRRDFDEKLAELQEVDPSKVKANVMGKAVADMAAEYGGIAKVYIDTVDKAFEPIEDAAKETLKRIRDLHNSIIAPAVQIRDREKAISRSYQLALDFKVQEERRALERQQREQAERERQAELEELRRREEEQRRQAAAAKTEEAKAAAEAEATQLAQEREQTAAASITPAVVSEDAVQSAAMRTAGVSGNFVYLHRIADWKTFCAMLATMTPTIEADGNETKIALPGIKATFNFTGMKKNQTALPGMAVQKDVETRNRRR